MVTLPIHDLRRPAAPGRAHSRLSARRKARRYVGVQRRGADSGLAANVQRLRGEQAAACRRPSATERSYAMPRMLVTTDSPDRSGGHVMLDEHVATSDLASQH